MLRGGRKATGVAEDSERQRRAVLQRHLAANEAFQAAEVIMALLPYGVADVFRCRFQLAGCAMIPAVVAAADNIQGGNAKTVDIAIGPGG